ncbi:MAG: glycosyltransferase family 4 protein [Actinomycetia bacterium]|nr:glycosyltransferase family 4 protein [Actinomycetes bacterium]
MVELHIVDNSHQDSLTMSGGERIAIELTRNWVSSGNVKVVVQGSNLTEALWRRYVEDPRISFSKISNLNENESLLHSYPKRVFQGIRYAFGLNMNPEVENLLYTASDFWPDSLPGLIIYLRNRDRCRWIAGFFMFAPNPLKGFRENGPWRLPSVRNIVYWASQKLAYHVVRRFADAVFVTSEPDVDRFVSPRRAREKVIVIRGGVDVPPADRLDEGDSVEDRYDAVFVGRFHPQKGVVELIDIWGMVCEEIPEARLALIGVGRLEEEVRGRITSLGLDTEIDVLGFLDGEPKHEVFRKSKLILHPALYDSGGMAAAEGMAFGLPGVSYDLLALRTYYPRGMAKVPLGHPEEFAGTIVGLLNNREERDNLGRQARELITREWSWDIQADRIWDSISAAGLLKDD